jgi:hypothetical protein
MEFTDQFIELPIKQFNQKEKDLLGTADYYDATIHILPTEISEFKESSDIDLGIEDIVHVIMKNGDAFNVYMRIDEFKKSLNAHAAYNGL